MGAAEKLEPISQSSDFVDSAQLWMHLKKVFPEKEFRSDPCLLRRSHILAALESGESERDICVRIGHSPPDHFEKRLERVKADGKRLPIYGQAATETALRPALYSTEFGSFIFERLSWRTYVKGRASEEFEPLVQLFWFVDQTHDPYDLALYELDSLIREMWSRDHASNVLSALDVDDNGSPVADEDEDEDDPVDVDDFDASEGVDAGVQLDAPRFYEWYANRAINLQDAYLSARKAWLTEWARRQKAPATIAHECFVSHDPIRPWPETGGVYIARMPGTNLVKIGKGNNVAKRLKGLLCGFPQPYELLCVVPGALAEESRIHRRFDHLRRSNGAGTEWFELASDLLAFITEVRSDVYRGSDA